MKKAIIFGAGAIGTKAYFKLRLIYDIVGYADNSAVLHGQKLNGVPIIAPADIPKTDCDVIICSDYHKEILIQLLDLGIENIRMIEPMGYFLYEYHPQKHMQPVEVPDFYPPFKKEKKGLHILFVQQHPCTRTHKIAEIILEKGVDASIAYTAEPPEYGHSGYAKQYHGTYAFFSAHDIIEFVNNSDFDLVHCSNEPDSLTNLMLLTNKPVVHDTHDWMSLNYLLGRDMLTVEYIANQKSDGCIYLNEFGLNLAKKYFHVKDEKSLLVENRPSQLAKPKEYLEKLSIKDGELHCVFEGGIVADKNHFRYMEDVWLALAKEGIHVHFYTQYNPEYCKKVANLHKKIHYEGNANSAELIQKMTQYDCGLALFQDLEQFKIHLETGIANKVFEYLAAGLPVAVGNIDSYKNFVEKYQAGACLDMQGDIKAQLEKISKIPIEENFIEKHQLTMKAQADKIIDFYKRTIANYQRNSR